jgi:hypothetical protein
MAGKAAKIIGFVIIAIIILIVVADVIMYIKRIGIYSFKAKPAPSTATALDTKGLKATKVDKYTTVFYPNGEPDPTTGKLKDSKPLASGISSRLNNNLTAYNTAGIQTNPSDWGPAPPSS